MNKRLCIFGEVLFDHFPDGKRVLGGAPFNVAWHLQAFGAAPWFISRVGDDREGESIRRSMHDWGMDTAGLQMDRHLPSGRVSVQLVDGEPNYDIVEPCAYDAIDAPEPGATPCRLLYHGSLALRNPASARAAEAIRATQPETVFVDVNLRPPWWRREQVLAMVEQAHWVKLNSEELQLLDQKEGETGARATEFLADYGLRGLVLTHGSAGAEVFEANGKPVRIRPQTDTTVVDTVGAGDAFTSVVILGLVNQWSPVLTVQRAQGFASAVVGQRGATVANMAFYRPFIEAWQLEQ